MGRDGDPGPSGDPGDDGKIGSNVSLLIPHFRSMIYVYTSSNRHSKNLVVELDLEEHLVKVVI